MSAFHTIKASGLTDAITTNENWDRKVRVPWKQIGKINEGDGVALVNEDGVWIGSIEEIGDLDLGQNFVTVDLM